MNIKQIAVCVLLMLIVGVESSYHSGYKNEFAAITGASYELFWLHVIVPKNPKILLVV